MPHCSNSDHNLAQTLAATIDDVLDLVTPGTPDFDRYARAAETLQPLEPSLVFLILQDASVVLLHAPGADGDLDLAEQVAECLAGLVPGETRVRRIDTVVGTRIAIAVLLSTEAGNSTLVCLFDPDQLAPLEGLTSEVGKTPMLGALCRVVAQCKIESTQMLVRAEQLAAGHEALQESYARSLTKAVEQREERLREQEEHTSRL